MDKTGDVEIIEVVVKGLRQDGLAGASPRVGEIVNVKDGSWAYLEGGKVKPYSGIPTAYREDRWRIEEVGDFPAEVGRNDIKIRSVDNPGIVAYIRSQFCRRSLDRILPSGVLTINGVRIEGVGDLAVGASYDKENETLNLSFYEPQG